MEVWSWVALLALLLHGGTLVWRRRRLLELLSRWDLTCCLLLGALIGPPLSPLLLRLGAVLSDRPPSLCCCILGSCCCSVLLVCSLAGKNGMLGDLGGRAVLVTGCDSGFGQALVDRLSLKGLKVFAGVLDLNGPGAQRLKELQRENLQLLQLDVTDGAQVEAALQLVSAQVSSTGLWGLVNNAGVLQCPVDAELQPPAALRRFLDVNFLSAVRMSQNFLPLLRRSRGRIVNVCSMAAEVPLPLFAAYGASKAALKIFSEVMRQELAPWGVRVSLIQPAGFRTNLFGDESSVSRHVSELLSSVPAGTREDYGDAYISSLPSGLSSMSRQVETDLSPVLDDMCDALLAANPRALYTPGRMAWLLPFLYRTCPTAAFDAIVRRLPKYTNQQPAGLRKT